MTIEEIKKQLQYGDYTTMAKMLCINASAAKTRFFREDPQAKEALEKIIETREKLIKDFHAEHNIN